uniref:Uncharacterized protein n=1 Tax=Ananas comosus var. bracteatus TaxID=296719 RepID=A0A6V7NQ54_ANACO|nr:unnamed protein product [Ananas comosus var. bracteatus]
MKKKKKKKKKKLWEWNVERECLLGPIGRAFPWVAVPLEPWSWFSPHVVLGCYRYTRERRSGARQGPMAPLPPLPSSPSLDYTILKHFVPSNPSRFILGPSFTDEPNPDDFPYSSDSLPLMAKSIHLHS